MDLLWSIEFTEGETDLVKAPTHAAATAAANRDYDSTEIVRVEPMAVLEALIYSFGEAWMDLDYVRCAIASDSRFHNPGEQRLVMTLAQPLADDGRQYAVKRANLLYLQQRWTGLAGLVVDHDSVAFRASAQAPGDFLDVVNHWIEEGQPLDHELYDLVRECSGFGQDRTTRVAVCTEDADWVVISCPTAALGISTDEAEAIDAQLSGRSWQQPVIVIDSVPGFPVGCSTYSSYDSTFGTGSELLEARAQHSECQHTAAKASANRTDHARLSAA